MSTELSFARDLQGYNAYAPKFSTNIYSATLVASAASSITVPSNYSGWIMYVRVQPNGWCWCSRTGTATIPSAGTFAASNSEIIVGTIEFKRSVLAGDVISFITENATCDIEVSLFANIFPH